MCEAGLMFFAFNSYSRWPAVINSGVEFVTWFCDDLRGQSFPNEVLPDASCPPGWCVLGTRKSGLASLVSKYLPNSPIRLASLLVPCLFQGTVAMGQAQRSAAPQRHSSCRRGTISMGRVPPCLLFVIKSFCHHHVILSFCHLVISVTL